jgi:hypothetical protein
MLMFLKTPLSVWTIYIGTDWDYPIPVKNSSSMKEDSVCGITP